jgi:hypothetical protein
MSAYLYKISAKGLAGDVAYREGTVTLLR